MVSQRLKNTVWMLIAKEPHQGLKISASTTTPNADEWCFSREAPELLSIDRGQRESEGVTPHSFGLVIIAVRAACPAVD